MLRTLFELGSFTDHQSAPLLMELGPGYCLLAKINPETRQPLFARLWAFDAMTMKQSLGEIRQLLNAGGITTAQTLVAVAFPEAIVLPGQLNTNPQELLEALFPGHIGVPKLFRSENQYAFIIPHDAADSLQRQFGITQPIPAIACLPAPEESGNSIHAFFIDSQFRVVVYKGHQLYLAQQYTFTVPLDVVYYLLKICTEFGLSQQDTLLSVSGFIAADSALYKELHQYFLNIRFGPTDTFSIDGQDVPKHLFSSLYNLAACAS